MVDSSGYARRWGNAIRVLENYHRQPTITPAIETNSGEEIKISPNPRNYTQEWKQTKYAQILDGDRELRDRFDDCHIVFLTLTASGYKNGKFTAPADHYNDLDSSWSKIYNKIRYDLHTKKGLDYEYLMVDGVHDSQKPVQKGSDNNLLTHRHCTFYFDGEVKEEDFHAAIDKHTETCDAASINEHPYDKAIRVRKASNIDLKQMTVTDRVRGKVTPAAWDMASHLPDLDLEYNNKSVRRKLVGSVEDKMFAGLMHCLNNKSWRSSKGYRSAYRDRFEDRHSIQHPDRWESDEDSDSELKGWYIDGEFVSKPDDDGSNDDNNKKLTECRSIPNYYK